MTVTVRQAKTTIPICLLIPSFPHLFALVLGSITAACDFTAPAFYHCLIHFYHLSNYYFHHLLLLVLLLLCLRYYYFATALTNYVVVSKVHTRDSFKVQLQLFSSVSNSVLTFSAGKSPFLAQHLKICSSQFFLKESLVHTLSLYPLLFGAVIHTHIYWLICLRRKAGN